MSLNLTVPTDSPNATSKPRVQRRAMSPAAKQAVKKTAARNSGISAHNIRAKSKSPNPSFCSVLSRVKDWELGAFTPKTPLPDNVDNLSDGTNTDESNPLLCPSQDASGAPPWRNEGSPEPKAAGEEQTAGAKLMKSNLSSNIGKSIIVNCVLRKHTIELGLQSLVEETCQYLTLIQMQLA